jgi:hypothetical protein
MNDRMPPIPIPLRNSEFWAGRKWDEESYMTTEEPHKCYSYPCFICHKEHYTPPDKFVSKSYICMSTMRDEPEAVAVAESEPPETTKIEEMKFDVVYESIDDLPECVFGDIAIDLLE